MHHRNGSKRIIPPIVEFRYFQKYHSGQNISVPRAKCSICSRWFSLNHPLDHLKREHALNFVSTTEVGSLFHAAVAAARKRLPLPNSSSHQEAADSEGKDGSTPDQASRSFSNECCGQSASGLVDHHQDSPWEGDGPPTSDAWVNKGSQFCSQFTMDDIEELANAFLSSQTAASSQSIQSQPFDGTTNEVMQKLSRSIGQYSAELCDQKRMGAKRDRKCDGVDSPEVIAHNGSCQNDPNAKKMKLSNGSGIGDKTAAHFLNNEPASMINGQAANCAAESPSTTATSASAESLETNDTEDKTSSDQQQEKASLHHVESTQPRHALLPLSSLPLSSLPLSSFNSGSLRDHHRDDHLPPQHVLQSTVNCTSTSQRPACSLPYHRLFHQLRHHQILDTDNIVQASSLQSTVTPTTQPALLTATEPVHHLLQQRRDPLLIQSLLLLNSRQSNLNEDLQCLSDCIDACTAHEKELQDHLTATTDVLSRLRRIQSSLLNQISTEISQILSLIKTTDSLTNGQNSNGDFNQFIRHPITSCSMYGRCSLVSESTQQKPPVCYQPFVCQPSSLSRSIINSRSTAMEVICPTVSPADATVKEDLVNGNRSARVVDAPTPSG